MSRTGILLLAALCTASLSTWAAPKSGAASKNKQTICWTDNTGARACGDRVPPEYAKQDREVLNAQGAVVSTKAREKTPAEIAEEQRQADAAAAEQKRRVQQTAYDSFMLQSYESVTAIQRVRDDNMKTLEGRLSLAEKAVVATETSLKSLRARAQGEADKLAKETPEAKDAREAKEAKDYHDCKVAREAKAAKDAKAAKAVKGKGKAPPPPPPETRDSCKPLTATEQVKQFEQSLVDSLKAVSSLKAAREETDARFVHDMARFKKLKAKEIAVGSPDTMPVTAPPKPIP